MSKQITAIKFKIDMKLREVQQQLKTIIDKTVEIKKTIDKKSTKMNNTHKIPTQIIPEVEIIRMNHIVQLQKELDMLAKQEQELNQEKARLDKMEIRLKTEVKRIENYAEKKKKQVQQLQLIQQNNLLDEWAIQQGVGYEN